MPAEVVAAFGEHISRLAMDATDPRVRTAAMQVGWACVAVRSALTALDTTPPQRQPLASGRGPLTSPHPSTVQ